MSVMEFPPIPAPQLAASIAVNRRLLGLPAQVVALERPYPHQQGEAFCMACNHNWQGVAPVGTVALECPSCHTHKGRFCFECVPPPDALVRSCDCGNQLFYLTPDGHLCPNCGTYQRYD